MSGHLRGVEISRGVNVSGVKNVDIPCLLPTFSYTSIAWIARVAHGAWCVVRGQGGVVCAEYVWAGIMGRQPRTNDQMLTICADALRRARI